MKAKNTLYVVVPCYKEEAVLPETSKRLKEKMTALMEQGKISEKSRVMFVNDGIRIMAEGVAKNGVTSFLPTTMTVDMQVIVKALEGTAVRKCCRGKPLSMLLMQTVQQEMSGKFCTLPILKAINIKHGA